MKVILDECLPKRWTQHFSEHEVTTVPLSGLAGYSNGKLLAALEARFDVFVTIDGNLQWQQNLEQRSLIVIVIRARSNRLEDLVPLTARVNEAIASGSGPIRHVRST